MTATTATASAPTTRSDPTTPRKRVPRAPTLALLAILGFLYWWLPSAYLSDANLRIVTLIGIYAIGAAGLNLLVGFGGQVSLGHAFFIAVGSYAMVHWGQNERWPLALSLVAAIVCGSLVALAVAPIALRLRGEFFMLLTLGLVFVGQHLWDNWSSLTGGGNGVTVSDAPTSVGPLNFRSLEVGGSTYTLEQGFFWLVWAIVAVVFLVVRNVIAARPGRALQGMRDAPLAAEAFGVRISYYRTVAFAWSGALGALCGALYALTQEYVNPSEFSIWLSITSLIIVLIGGAGSVLGPLYGAFFVIGGQAFIESHASSPLLSSLITDPAGTTGLVSIGEFNGMVFGLLLVLVVVVEPGGLHTLGRRGAKRTRTVLTRLGSSQQSRRRNQS